MQEIVTNFHFLRPWWLVLLIVPAVFYWRFFNHSGGLSSWVKVCDKKLLAQELDVHFPDDEAANIALHLVNAEYENSISDTLRITQTLHDILSTLTGWPRLHLDTASGFYDEFTVHLKFLVLRAFSGNGQPRGDEGFVASVRRCYPDEFHCAQQIIEGLERRTGNSLPAEEQAYLAASLHRTCRLV